MITDISFESITCISDLLNIISKIKEKYGKKTEFGGCVPSVNGKLNDQADFWFRGESNVNYKLCPKVMRNGQFVVEYFDEPLSRFTKEANAHLSNIDLTDTLLCMEYAQHYGTPTRLLDFSTNPLVALWFACLNSNTDGHIWIFNEHNYSHVSSLYFLKTKGGEGVDNKKLRDFNLNSTEERIYPAIVHPNYVDSRMLAQSSRFLLWPNCAFALDELIAENNLMLLDECALDPLVERFAYKVIIPKDKKWELLKELDMIGINEKMLFPGLDGIGRYSDYLFRNN